MYYEWILGFIKCFSYINWDHQIISPFISLLYFIKCIINVHYIGWFSCIEPSLHSKNKSHLDILYNTCNILFACILLSYFSSMCVRYCSGITFLVLSLTGFDVRVMLASWNDLGSVFAFPIFWKGLRSISVCFFF